MSAEQVRKIRRTLGEIQDDMRRDAERYRIFGRKRACYEHRTNWRLDGDGPSGPRSPQSENRGDDRQHPRTSNTGQPSPWSRGFRRRSAWHYMHYNFARIHKTLRVTPAMQAGIADHVWSLSEIVALLDADEARQAA